MPKLEEFYFYENTDVADSDMTPLIRHPSLKDVSFMNRKHYLHRREELQQWHP